ncbi:MAG: putative ABC transport system permease protein [Marivirga sp.]|jgi:putative ABC transport system permease protein
MLKNYFKIAFRNLAKHKLYTAINLIGLSVGLGVSILIFLFVQHENTFDNFHEKGDRIVRVLWESGEVGNVSIGASTPLAVPSVLKDKFDGILKSTHYIDGEILVKKENSSSQNQEYMAVSSDFLDIFSFPAIHGVDNPFTTGASANAVVITESTAIKYFGKSDATGETLLLQLAADFEPFVVKTVLADLPANSSIQFEILLPEHTLRTTVGENYAERWQNTYGGSFLLLDNNASIETLQLSFATLIDDLVVRDEESEVFNLSLQPLDEIHLDGTISTSSIASTNPKLLWILTGVAILILLIACINFTTLSIGRSATRAKEVGVRKTMGAAYNQLFKQFMTESLLLTIVSAILGLLLATLLLSTFNDLFDKSLEIIFSPVQVLIIIGLLLFITFLSGAYPALFLSRLKPIAVLKSSLNMNFGKQGLRRLLVGIQFFISLFLLACTLIMFRQMDAINNYDLGFTKDAVLMVEVPAIPAQSLPEMLKNSFKKANRFKQIINRSSKVKAAGISNATYGNRNWWTGGFPNDAGEMQYFKFGFVDTDYADLMGYTFKEGRNFSSEFASDSNAFIINESFAQKMKLTNPLREQIQSAKDEGFDDHKIIGVITDFHQGSLYDEIEPLILTMDPELLFSGINSLNIMGASNPTVFIKSATNDFGSLRAYLAQEWSTMYPDEPFTFQFLDEVVQAQYIADQRLSKMVAIASIIAIIIAAMGLFALASLAITGRLKEIGVRKVMGASVFNISMLFNKEFLKITIVGMLFSLPFSYWLMNEWLKQFEVKAGLSASVFLITIVIGVFFTIAIVSVQTIKAGNMNPVKILKDE